MNVIRSLMLVCTILSAHAEYKLDVSYVVYGKVRMFEFLAKFAEGRCEENDIRLVHQICYRLASELAKINSQDYSSAWAASRSLKHAQCLSLFSRLLESCQVRFSGEFNRFFMDKLFTQEFLDKVRSRLVDNGAISGAPIDEVNNVPLPRVAVIPSDSIKLFVSVEKDVQSSNQVRIFLPFDSDMVTVRNALFRVVLNNLCYYAEPSGRAEVKEAMSLLEQDPQNQLEASFTRIYTKFKASGYTIMFNVEGGESLPERSANWQKFERSL